MVVEDISDSKEDNLEKQLLEKKSKKAKLVELVKGEFQ